MIDIMGGGPTQRTGVVCVRVNDVLIAVKFATESGTQLC